MAKEALVTSAQSQDCFRVAYWVVGQTHDSKAANAQVGKKNVSIAITIDKDTTTTNITVPTIVNSKLIKEGEEIIVYMEDIREPIACVEPPPKKLRTDEVARVKGRGKGKGSKAK